MVPLPEDAAPVKPGDVLFGKYRVDRRVGGGGMGVVFAVEHLVLGELVALKVLRAGRDAGHERRERFLREAKLLARVRSENVARVLDAGTLPDDTPFLVMELLEGRDLGETLLVDGPLPVTRAVDCVLQACEALAHAHAAGIVHRDLKPSNLFLAVGRDGERRLKVLDFGISKLTSGEDDQGLTGSQAVMGSPLYMSPEQVRAAKHVDARADVWSLGVVLHELLAGEPPFRGDTASALFAAIAADPPTPLLRAAPGVPPELSAIVARCLEKDPTGRFSSVLELARALEPFAPGRVGTSSRIAHVLGASGAVTSDPATKAVLPPGGETLRSTGTDFGRTGVTPKKSRAPVVVIAGVALAAVAAFSSLRTGNTPAPLAADSRPSATGVPQAASPPAAAASSPPLAATTSPSPASPSASAPPATPSTSPRAPGAPRPASPRTSSPDLPGRKEF